MRTLIVMCGLPGAGKSTKAKILATDIVSLDEVREFIFGTRAEQKLGDLVYRVAIEKLKYLLKEDKNQTVVYDATNVTRAARVKVLGDLKTYYEVAECYRVKNDIIKTKARNKQRAADQVVPDEVIDKMASKWQEPTFDEGFSIIY